MKPLGTTLRIRLLLTGAVAGVLGLTGLTAAARSEAPREIEVSAKRFEFTPKTIELERGETIKLRLRSEDVRHGFYQKDLGIDAEFVPQEWTEILVTPREAGSFTAICDRFCGAGHGGMKLTFVVAEKREP